jgi:hypothetical protein
MISAEKMATVHISSLALFAYEGGTMQGSCGSTSFNRAVRLEASLDTKEWRIQGKFFMQDFITNALSRVGGQSEERRLESKKRQARRVPDTLYFWA